MTREYQIGQVDEEAFRAILLGTHPSLHRRRRFHLLIPSNPRCKLCNAPFGGIGGPIMRLLGRKPYPKNPTFCGACLVNFKSIGVEVEITMLFADVRGSTGMAEKLSPGAFSQLMNRFYAASTHVLISSNALIDKLVGDEVIGLFIPGFAGHDHARQAIHAAQDLLKATGHGSPSGPWVPVGVGVHTGIAHVGPVGVEGGINDITALGDSMNTTARLASLAAAGEILVSEATCKAASFSSAAAERRELQLKGRAEPVAVQVVKV